MQGTRQQVQGRGDKDGCPGSLSHAEVVPITHPWGWVGGGMDGPGVEGCPGAQVCRASA